MLRSKKVPPYLLTVLTGPNAGAELGLSGARRTLGSGSRQDIQLEGLPASALRFLLEGDRLSLRPEKGVEVAIRGAKPLADGRTHKIKLPVQLTVDGVTLHICRMQAARGFGRMLAVVSAATAAVALLAFGSSTVALFSDVAGASSMSVVNATPARPQTQTPAQPVRSACAADCIAEAAEAFRVLVTEAGLDGVTITPDGSILRVTTQGIVRGDPRWSAARAAYDKAWSSRVPLLLQKLPPVPKAPFAVQSVWLGEPAELTTRDGDVFRVGSVVPGGWTIEEIASGRVDLSLGEARIRIEF